MHKYRFYDRCLLTVSLHHDDSLHERVLLDHPHRLPDPVPRQLLPSCCAYHADPAPRTHGRVDPGRLSSGGVGSCAVGLYRGRRGVMRFREGGAELRGQADVSIIRVYLFPLLNIPYRPGLV